MSYDEWKHSLVKDIEERERQYHRLMWWFGIVLVAAVIESLYIIYAL